MQKGWTLIELVIVLVLIGILAVVALPQILDLAADAEQSSRDSIVGAVVTGLELYRSNDLATGGTGTFPAQLDGNADGGPCTNCFSAVLDHPLNDSNWTRLSATQYTFTDGTSTMTYTYNPSAGTFQ